MPVKDGRAAIDDLEDTSRRITDPVVNPVRPSEVFSGATCRGNGIAARKLFKDGRDLSCRRVRRSDISWHAVGEDECCLRFRGWLWLPVMWFERWLVDCRVEGRAEVCNPWLRLRCIAGSARISG